MVYMVQLAELSSTFPCERQTYDEFWWEVPGLIMGKKWKTDLWNIIVGLNTYQDISIDVSFNCLGQVGKYDLYYKNVDIKFNYISNTSGILYTDESNESRDVGTWNNWVSLIWTCYTRFMLTIDECVAED
jgi:hypothetical protein